MMYTQKRKMKIAVAIVLAVGLIVAAAVWWIWYHAEYTDFCTMQVEPVDLGLFGITPTNGEGLDSTASWVGKGYACTMKQNGKTGQRMSVPYIQWSLSDVNGGAAHWSIQFGVAERAMLNGQAENSASPWKYSNIEITLVAGAQTDLAEISSDGLISKGNQVMVDDDEIPLEVSVLSGRLCDTEQELEQALAQEQGKQNFRMNTSTFMVQPVYAVRMRLPENRSWKNSGYHLNGSDPGHPGRFVLSCEPVFYNRSGKSQTEFPQTSYFKVTYDVENTVTGERVTHTTGWISRTYVSRLR